MHGESSHDPVCANVVKDGNYAGTLKFEVTVSSGSAGEDEMERWLILNGPISVAMDAAGMDSYTGGIDMGDVRFVLARGLRQD